MVTCVGLEVLVFCWALSAVLTNAQAIFVLAACADLAGLRRPSQTFTFTSTVFDDGGARKVVDDGNSTNRKWKYAVWSKIHVENVL